MDVDIFYPHFIFFKEIQISICLLEEIIISNFILSVNVIQGREHFNCIDILFRWSHP